MFGQIRLRHEKGLLCSGQNKNAWGLFGYLLPVIQINDISTLCRMQMNEIWNAGYKKLEHKL